MKVSNYNLLKGNINAFNINYYKNSTLIYGPYKRTAIWFQGCTLNCKGCINKELQPLQLKTVMETNDIINISKADGHITLLGGEPLQQPNIKKLIKELKSNNIGIVLFTGYEESEISKDLKEYVDMCDIVVFGRYIEKYNDSNLYLRGSTNQVIKYNTNLYDSAIYENETHQININNELEYFGRNNNFLEELLE